MNPPELIVPFPLLQQKNCVDVPDSLCPLSYSCILCLYATFDLYRIPILDLFSMKIFHIPLTLSYYLTPPFGYLQTFHFILKMNERI